MLDAKFNKLAISSAIENHGDITPYENETQQRQYFKNLNTYIAQVIIKIFNSSVIRQKGESQDECFKKTKHANCIFLSCHVTRA